MRSLSTRMLAARARYAAGVVRGLRAGIPGSVDSRIATLFHRFQALQLEDAVAALGRGGSPEASTYVDRLWDKLGFVPDGRPRPRRLVR